MASRLSALIIELWDIRPPVDDELELFITFVDSLDRAFVASNLAVNELGFFGASRRENALLNLLASDFASKLDFAVSAFAVETRNLLSPFGCLVESPVSLPLRLAARLAMPCRPLSGRTVDADSFRRDD